VPLRQSEILLSMMSNQKIIPEFPAPIGLPPDLECGEFIDPDPSSYISKFGDISKLPRQVLLDELDRVWINYGLDNSIPLSEQIEHVSKFYGHPVWVLNGIFSELDPTSKGHREAIAQYIKNLNISRVADYGAGSGVLARFIAGATNAQIDIIEPYPSDSLVENLICSSKINIIPHLVPDYDVIIAQDVLEHVDNPVDLAFDLINSTKMGGYLIFANCFYPVIKCHLPSTFYLRHTFSYVMSHAGLMLVESVKGAQHALVFKRIGPARHQELAMADKRAKSLGLMLNRIHAPVGKVKQLVRRLWKFD